MSDDNIPQDPSLGGGEAAAPEPVQIYAGDDSPAVQEPVADEQSTDDDHYEPTDEDRKEDVYANARVTMDKDPSKPATAADMHHLSIASTDKFSELIDVISELTKSLKSANPPSPEAMAWATEWQQAARHVHNVNPYPNAFDREDGDWRQGTMYENVNYRMGKPKFDGQGNGQLIRGEQAIYHINSLVGLGAVVNVPLWTTGIWITIKAPTNSQLAELDERIAAIKVSLGANSAGLVFSADVAFLMMEVFDLAMRHVVNSTLLNFTPKSLKATILTPDILAVIHGLACAIYSDGYPMSRPCVSKTCMHVSDWTLSLSLLSWTDNNRLTSDQKKHMSRRNEKVDIAALNAYQSQHAWVGKTDFVSLTDGAISIKFKIPTAFEYETTSHEWIDGIVNTMDSALSEQPLTGKLRNDYILTQGVLSTLRQYGHWIARITTSSQHIVEDQETLQKSLEHLSGSPELVESFFEAVATFIDGTAITIIGIPKYACEKCGVGQVPDNELDNRKHPNLIVLDPVELFFTLMTQRIVKLIGN